MLGLTQSLGHRLEQKQRLFFGETLGEIPLYSLHRIKNLMQKKGMNPLNMEIKNELIRHLVLQNIEYQRQSKNKWSCITSDNLLDVFAGVRETLDNAVRGLDLDLVRMPGETRFGLLRRLINQRTGVMSVIEKWFLNNFDVLMYDRDGNIPWAVVRRLRASLNLWITTRTNAFGTDIEDAVLDIARKNGIVTRNPEDAWIKMGGKLFVKK